MFRSDILYINDILSSINAIEEFISDMDFKAFSNDRKTSSATIRELEVIGEAVGKVSVELKTEYQDINWRDIKDLRNLLIHEYFGIDLEIIWNIVIKDIPTFKNNIIRVSNYIKDNKAKSKTKSKKRLKTKEKRLKAKSKKEEEQNEF